MKDNAVQDFVESMQTKPTDDNKTYSAIVARVDGDGIVWVNLAGSDKETPTASTSAEVKKGDVVTVEWRNNKLYIAGNYSNPSAGVVRVGAVEAAANTAREAANNAVADASRAREAADSVHGIAVQAQEDAEAAQNSLKSVVQGATTVEKAVSVMQTALEAVAEYDPNAITETFTGDGTETDFTLENKATNILSVTVDGESAEYTTAVVGGVTVVTITPAPDNNAEVSVSYDTTKEWFWHDANGAHVLGDDNGYRNDMTSTGMKVMDVTNEESVAEFGVDGSKIGSDSRIEIRQYGLQLFKTEEASAFSVLSNGASEQDIYITDGRILNKTVTYTGNRITCSLSEDEVYKRTGELYGTKLYCRISQTVGSSGTSAYFTINFGETMTGVKFSGLPTMDIKCIYPYTSTDPVSVVCDISPYSSASRNLTLEVIKYLKLTTVTTYMPTFEFGGGSTKEYKKGGYSSSLGKGAVASADNQVVVGKWNDVDLNDENAFIIGNGTAEDARSNALTVDWDGNVEASGDVTDGSGNVLSDKADSSTIPSKTSDLTNDSKFITPTFAASGTTANFVIERYSKSFSNVASGDTWVWEETRTKSGYYPLGIVGYRIARSTLLPYSCRLASKGSGTCDIELSARAVAAANAATAYVDVLWIKE